MTKLLAPAHLALTVVILIWNIVLAGRIAQNRQAPPLFQAISGLAALLILPGLLFALATSTIMTGRAVATMDWMWPVVLVLFALQALYALAKRLVNIAWGLPIAIYDILIATIGVTRYMVAHGSTPPDALVALLAAQTIGMVFMTNTANVLATPFYLNMPMVSPAFPATRNAAVAFRAFMSLLAVAWCAAILAIGGFRAVTQLRNYEVHRNDQLRERPNADFAVGLKILPDIRSAPPPPAIRADSALLDSLGVDALSVVVVPGASRASIDSLARVLAAARGDSTTLIVALGYRGKLIPELGRSSLDESVRLATLRQVIARLHPDIVLPAEDPYTTGQRIVGAMPPDRWEAFLTTAARVAKSVDRKVKVGVAASAFTRNDSILYAWAASPTSPIDVVGFSLFPSPYVGGGIQADTRTADRWMRATPPKKEHWIFATGGYPLAYGERSQENAIWEVMAWGTDHPIIKGMIVFEAGDYGQSRGLRAPNGRLRIATRRLMSGIQQIRESAR